MVAITHRTWQIVEGHVASCGFFDEDQTTNLKEEVGLRHGNVSTNCAQRECIAAVQSFFTKSDSRDFSRSFLYKLMFSLSLNLTFD